MKSLKDIESVGWGFFLLCVALLLAPSIYIAWQSTYDVSKPVTRIGIGLMGALFAACPIAWSVNAMLHQRNVRRYKLEQKDARKIKVKKKRGKKR